MLSFFFDEDEHIQSHSSNQDYNCVEYSSPRQNDSAPTHAILEKLVVERVESEVRIVLNLVEAFCAAVDGYLGQADEERQQD